MVKEKLNIPLQITTERWLEFAASFPVAFAQVREDPLVDLWVIDQLPEKAKGIMIASGGCTASILAASGKFQHLDLVDMNPAQLALTQLKMHLLQDFTPQERLQLLGHHPKPLISLAELLQRYDFSPTIFGDPSVVESIGIDFSGRYEVLFARLQYVIAHHQCTQELLNLSQPEQQSRYLVEHPEYVHQLEQAFQEVMALPHLVRLFGETATQNAVMPFAQHFWQRTMRAMQNMPNAKNPYLSQLLLGRFYPNSNYYPWLQLPRSQWATNIYPHLGTMKEILDENEQDYDFIHLSNVLDWLNPQEASSLLQVALQRLKPEGWIIIRQLNSTLNIPQLCPALLWHVDQAQRLHKQDRSFFYQHLHLAQRV